MRPMSRAHLARQLAAAITRAACKGQGEAWTEWEAALADAVTPAQAEAAAAPALAVCAGCPEVTRCSARAESRQLHRPGRGHRLGQRDATADRRRRAPPGTTPAEGRMSAPDFAHSRQAERRRQEKARTLARWSCVRSPPGPDKTEVVYCRKNGRDDPFGTTSFTFLGYTIYGATPE